LSLAKSLRGKLAAEFVGTFVFVLVGAGSSLVVPTLTGGQSPSLLIITLANESSSLLIAALANGLGLAMAVSATMGVSGGVLNPAVAVGLLIGRKLSKAEIIPYIVAELAGAIIAGSALVAAFPSTLGEPRHWGAPTLSALLTVWQGIAVEALLTFVLVIAVYGTAVDARAPRIGGLGIGLALMADVLVGGPFTGAAVNPARAMGPMVAGLFFPGYWYIYWVGPVIGAAAAGLVYRYALESDS